MSAWFLKRAEDALAVHIVAAAFARAVAGVVDDGWRVSTTAADGGISYLRRNWWLPSAGCSCVVGAVDGDLSKRCFLYAVAAVRWFDKNRSRLCRCCASCDGVVGFAFDDGFSFSKTSSALSKRLRRVCYVAEQVGFIDTLYIPYGQRLRRNDFNAAACRVAASLQASYYCCRRAAAAHSASPFECAARLWTVVHAHALAVVDVPHLRCW